MSATIESVSYLNQLATKLVGDGIQPDLFFVCLEADCQMVCTDFETAYEYWNQITFSTMFKETSLEGRRFGIIASRQFDENRPDRMFIIDDSNSWRNDYQDK